MIVAISTIVGHDLSHANYNMPNQTMIANICILYYLLIVTKTELYWIGVCITRSLLYCVVAAALQQKVGDDLATSWSCD